MVSNPNINADIVNRIFNNNTNFIEIFESRIKKQPSKEQIPTSIFSNKNLGILESTVKYLKENDLTYHEIAVMLNRDDRTIWTTYNKACKKDTKKTQFTDSITIKPNIFVNRKMAPLEAIIKHLKDRGMTLKQISITLNRSYKTIWLTDNKKR